MAIRVQLIKDQDFFMQKEKTKEMMEVTEENPKPMLVLRCPPRKEGN